MAALSLGSIIEGGGTFLTYVAANLPDDAKFTCYESGPPSKPYCVYVNAASNGAEAVVDGYGRDVKRPIFHETVAVGLKPRRVP
jgi:hypothetical protein